MHIAILFALPWALAGAEPAPPPPEPALRGLERSVVRLTNTSQRPDWRIPWNPGRPRVGQGSGFLIEGGRILTNAHVVADSKDLVIQLHDDADPHPARIVAVGHDCDLALVEPVEQGVLDGLVPLDLGGFPALGDEVSTLGYPVGGRWLSSTRGTVSRIDVISSVHSGGSAHLAVQTDAAINPGNSGGPVLAGRRVVGVAFQAAADLENTGYFIPMPIVRHFLEDVADGEYGGFPRLDVFFADLDAPAARARAGMEQGETGVRVDFVHPGSPAHGVLRPEDILLTLDGEILTNDGTFRSYDQRLQLEAILDRFQAGDAVPARVLRAGERMDLAVPVSSSVFESRTYETTPRYVVYAGLVFVPLERSYMEVIGVSGNRDVLWEYAYRQLSSPDVALPGRVVLLRRLDAEVNATVGAAPYTVLDRVNGQPITCLEDLVAALDENQGRYQVFEFAHVDTVVVLDREAAAAAHPRILERYAVTPDRRL
ncbi:MAG: trypsin-like peptidase domain-containing protein [Pseudomonadota bacterium]